MSSQAHPITPTGLITRINRIILSAERHHRLCRHIKPVGPGCLFSHHSLAHHGHHRQPTCHKSSSVFLSPCVMSRPVEGEEKGRGEFISPWMYLRISRYLVAWSKSRRSQPSVSNSLKLPEDKKETLTFYYQRRR